MSIEAEKETVGKFEEVNASGIPNIPSGTSKKYSVFAHLHFVNDELVNLSFRNDETNARFDALEKRIEELEKILSSGMAEK
jgi:hypothetical protein